MLVTLIETRIDKIRASLVQLKQRLDALGYEFQESEAVLPGPSDTVDDGLARLDEVTGLVPPGLTLFYQRIGSINFLGHHPEWEEQDGAYTDPLFVYPVSEAINELEQFLDDRERYLDAFGTFRVPIAPDCYHKADVSGGMWYNISLPDSTEDPRLLDEWHETTFLNYLEIAIRWGGFPGIERWKYQGHNWPINELAAGL